MKKISAILLTSILTAGISLNASASEDHRHGDCDHSELGEQMKDIKSAFKGLRKASDLTEKLALVEQLKTSAEASLLLEPIKLQDLSDEVKKAEFKEAYAQGMNDLIVMLDQFKEAAEAGDKSTQREIIKKLGKHSKESHVDFKKDCD